MERYQVVLYNMEALQGIHPVSDDVLFEQPLTPDEKIRKIKAIGNSWDCPEKIDLARLGYKHSDKMHVYYQIRNGISGYKVYYFTFTPIRDVYSMVDSEASK